VEAPLSRDWRGSERTSQTVVVAGGSQVLISHPDAVAALIEKAAARVK